MCTRLKEEINVFEGIGSERQYLYFKNIFFATVNFENCYFENNISAISSKQKTKRFL